MDLKDSLWDLCAGGAGALQFMPFAATLQHRSQIDSCKTWVAAGFSSNQATAQQTEIM